MESPRPVSLTAEHESTRSGVTPLTCLLIGLAFLAGVGVAAYRHRMDVNRLTEVGICGGNASAIGHALDRYANDHGEYPASQYELVPDYMRRLPSCPTARRMTYRSSFGPYIGTNREGLPAYYLVECTGDAHAGFLPPDFPSYDSTFGLMLREMR